MDNGIHIERSLDGAIKKYDDLFKAEHLLNDNTQRILLPYIRRTGLIINKLVKLYDKEGYAVAFPSLDLGIPNNKLRLAGGFATGMIVYWQCRTPLVFVDATVNVCSSSYFELEPVNDIRTIFNEKTLLNMMKQAEQSSYQFNLTSGNHFIMLCRSKKTGKLYLVIHFSDMQAKDVQEGLYPNQDIWYSNYIKTYRENDGRYIRYLDGAMAEKFILKAKNLQERNTFLHNWAAKKIGGQHVRGQVFHHYGMPMDNCIIIGSFLTKKNQVLPVFTNSGKPILLFKPSPNMWKLLIEKEEYFLVPHGWGQQIAQQNDFSSLQIRNSQLKFMGARSSKCFLSEGGLHFPKSFAEVRNFDKIEDFLTQSRHYLDGELIDVLEQKAVYSKEYNHLKYYR